jgi:tRNA1Val (adenine37-N6)-methyltransferase
VIEDLPFPLTYSQPEAYHFCQDSILFPRLVARSIQQNILEKIKSKSARVLDIGAGCGVLGLELALQLPDIESIDFLEIQNGFQAHFEINRLLVSQLASRSAAPSREGFRWINGNYEMLLNQEFTDCYDLIIANPPYFFMQEGIVSTSSFKSRCRFFLDSDFKTLIHAVVNALKPNGQAFLLVKSGERHGRSSLGDIWIAIGDSGKDTRRFQVSEIGDIRGTGVIEIRCLLDEPSLFP